MATHYIHTKHLFKVVNPDQFKEVRHYELLNEDSQKTFLPHWANISKNREFNNSLDVGYWYKNKELNGKSWSKVITGLKRTPNNRVYFGDIPKVEQRKFKPQHFLIFIFSKNGLELTVYTFENFYPSDEKGFINNFRTNLQ